MHPLQRRLLSLLALRRLTSDSLDVNSDIYTLIELTVKIQPNPILAMTDNSSPSEVKDNITI